MTAHSTMNRSLSRRFDDYRPTKTLMVWACILSVVATMVVGFGWGGWVTGSTSRATAATAGEAGRGELASAICVERFNAAPDAAARRTEFKALGDSYRKRQFIEAGGWATMPGQKTPDSLGVQGCAAALAA